MNLSSLLVTILTIGFIRLPVSVPDMCKDVACNMLYTPTTERVYVSDCACNESTHTFVYPAGYSHVDVNYSMTYPISHDFFQNDTLVGSCTPGLLCSQRVYLNPKQELTTVITEDNRDEEEEEKTVLYSCDNYDLLFSE